MSRNKRSPIVFLPLPAALLLAVPMVVTLALTLAGIGAARALETNGSASGGGGVIATSQVAAKGLPGKSGDHTWLFGKNPIRWQSCKPLTYRVNSAEAPKGWKQTVDKALEKATQASGIRFEYLGKSRQVVKSRSRNPGDTDVMFAFLAPRQTDMLDGGYNAGQGGASSDGRELSNGKVVLNGLLLKSMAPGFGVGPDQGFQGTQGQVMMHEIGHMLGLGHAKSEVEIMYPVATHKPADWAAGDYQGLRALGSSGCSASVVPAPKLSPRTSILN